MKNKVVLNDRFDRKDSMITESGHSISKGDLIKINGQHGSLFKFQCLVTNPSNGTQWIDCFEMFKGISGPTRSFYPDTVRIVSKRGKRVKRSSTS